MLHERMVDISDYRLRVAMAGQSGPMVVLEAGSGQTSKEIEKA